MPLFITLRRFTAAASMAADRIALGKAPPRGAVLASCVMAAGAALAALTEARTPGLFFGCAAVLANAGLTAWYLARLRQRAPPPGLSASGLLAYTLALAVPFLAAAAVVSGEAAGAWRMARSYGSSSDRGRGGEGKGLSSAFPLLSSAAFSSPHAVAAALFASALLGGCVHHATYVSSRAGAGGPSLAAKAGAAKNVLMMLVGAFAFGDYEFSWANAAGHAASTAGALWFGHDAAARARAKRGQQATPLVRRDPSGNVPLIGRDRLGRLDAARRAREAAAKAAAAAARGESSSLSSSSSPQQQQQQQQQLPPRSPEQQQQQQPNASTAALRGSPSPARAAALGAASGDDETTNNGSSSSSTPPPPPPVRGDDSRV